MNTELKEAIEHYEEVHSAIFPKECEPIAEFFYNKGKIQGAIDFNKGVVKDEKY